MMEGIKHTLNCQVDQYGNLRVNMTELREIVKRYPNQKAIMTIEILDGGDTEVMKAWYRNYVLPKVITAWRELGENYTLEQADRELVKLTTVRKIQAAGEPWIANLEDLDRTELKRYLDEVALMCSMNLNLIL